MRKSTPTTLQMQAADCGAASTKMCLDTLGCTFSLDEVRDIIGVGRDGSSVGDIVKGLQKYEIEVLYNKATTDELIEFAPCILWWNKNHFVVYEGNDNNIFYLNDPAQGKRSISKEEFTSQYSGIFIKPTKLPEKLLDFKSRNVVNLIALFKSFFSIVQYPLVLGVILALLSSIPTLFTAQITSFFIDNVIMNGDIRVGISLLWVLFFLCGLSVLISYVTFSIYSRATYISTNLKSYSFAKRILNLPHKWFVNRQTEEVSTRFEIPSQITDSVCYDSTELIATVGKALIISVTIYFISPPVGIFITLLVIFLAFFSNFIKEKTDVINKKQELYEGVAQGVSISTLSELHQLRVLSMESTRFGMWSGYYTNMVNASQTISFYENMLGLVSNSSYYLLITFLLVAGPILITQNLLTLGDYIAIQYLLAMVNSGIRALPGLVKEYQAITSPTERLRDIFEQPSLTTTLRSPVFFKKDTISLEFENLTFGYDTRNEVFSDVSLTKTLEDILIIQSDPSDGKSTFLQLISGLLMPIQGSINYCTGGKKINPSEIKMTYIASPRSFIEGNVIDNITFKDPAVTIEDAFKASELCGIHISSSISDLPVYQHGGRELSVTDKELIVLARIACSRDPLILIDDLQITSNSDIVKKVFQKLIDRGQKIIVTSTCSLSQLSSFKTSTINISGS